MKPSKIAVEVATRFLQSGDDPSEYAPKRLLKAVEEAQSVLHGAGRSSFPPKDVSIKENKAYSRITRATKDMYEQSETIRLDLDEWIINYAEARETDPPKDDPTGA